MLITKGEDNILTGVFTIMKTKKAIVAIEPGHAAVTLAAMLITICEVDEDATQVEKILCGGNALEQLFV